MGPAPSTGGKCSPREQAAAASLLPYLSTQHMSSRCCGTCAGLRRAGQSERRQARKARVLLERSSLARPNHRRRRLGQVHSRKHSAGISSGVRADLALPLLHSLTITGGTERTPRKSVAGCSRLPSDAFTPKLAWEKPDSALLRSVLFLICFYLN